MDNERRTQYDIVTANLDDYIIDKRRLIGSCIHSSDEYRFNYLGVDDYTSGESVGDGKKLDNNLIDGKPILGKEYIWTKSCTTANATFNHYTYAVLLRTLTINATGIMVI